MCRAEIHTKPKVLALKFRHFALNMRQQERIVDTRTDLGELHER